MYNVKHIDWIDKFSIVNAGKKDHTGFEYIVTYLQNFIISLHPRLANALATGFYSVGQVMMGK